jgi:hypothetical protein
LHPEPEPHLVDAGCATLLVKKYASNEYSTPVGTLELILMFLQKAVKGMILKIILL